MGKIIGPNGEKNVPCNGCTVCCRWGKDLGARPPVTPEDVLRAGINAMVIDGQYAVMPAKENGDCMYLDDKKGCTIWNLRPQACREFDCRDLLDELLKGNDTMINIIVAAVKCGAKN